jgi:hypothetical protein
MVQLGKRIQSGLKSGQNGETPPFSSGAQRTTAVLPPLGGQRRRRIGSQVELAEDLEGMAASLAEVNPRAAERLEDLADSISTEEGRLRWADVDMRQAFNTEALSHAYAVRREGGFVPPSVDKADKVRNVLVLLPILLTWAALAEASSAYDRYLEKHPDQIGQPFLLLWQRGFGGESSFLSPTFSMVGVMDALIIGVIIILTFYSHGRREEREEAIQRTASTFQTDLDNTLAEATVALAPDRAGRPAMLARSVERLAERFDMNSQELLTRLKVEHDRLEAIANRREREFADFGVFASGMRAGAEETHRLLIDLRQVSTGLTTSLEDLTSELGVAGEQQRSLHSAVTSLERLVATNIQSDHSVMRQLSDAANILAEAAERSITGADTAAQAGRVASEAVRGIAEISAGLATSQSRLEQSIANETETNVRLVESLRTGMNGVGATTKSLMDIVAGLSHLKEEFTRIGDLSHEHSLTLSRLLTEQNAIATGLAQTARDLGTASRGREGGEDASGIARRLDSISNQISRSPYGGSPEREDPLDTPATRRWPRRD